jgi:hypothetical protein
MNDELKVKLVEDWAAITQKSMLVKLPRSPTVSSVLQDYADQAMQKGWASSAVTESIVCIPVPWVAFRHAFDQ